MNKKISIIIAVGIVALITVFGFTAFQKQNRVSVQPTIIKIGAILPLTGDLATYGESMRNAILLAKKQSQVSSGTGENVQIIFEDDKGCVVKDAVSAAQKLININKVQGIIGTACSSSTLGIATITEKNKIVIVSPSSTSKSITTAGRYVFRTIASDSDKSVAVAKYAYDNGYKKAAILYDQSGDAFVQQQKEVTEAFTKDGGTIVMAESFAAKDTDFRTQLTKIKSSNVQVLFVASLPIEGALIFKQARELGITFPFIATDPSVATQDVITTAGTAAEGVVFPFASTPTNKEYDTFVKDYKATYHSDPTAFAAESYDATLLLIKSIAQSDRSGDSIAAQLMLIGNNFDGASGVITFDQNGDVQKPLVIRTIKNGQFVDLK